MNLPATQASIEKTLGDIGKIVGLVDDHRVGAGQEITEPLLLHRQVRHQQVVIDDDEVRFPGRLTRRDDMTIVESRATRAETIVHRRCDARPQRRVLRNAIEFRHIAGTGAGSPRLQLVDFPGGRFPALTVESIVDAVEPIEAQIVRSTL